MLHIGHAIWLTVRTHTGDSKISITGTSRCDRILLAKKWYREVQTATWARHAPYCMVWRSSLAGGSWTPQTPPGCQCQLVVLNPLWVLPVAQVRDCIEKENVSGQPKGDLPPLPPPGHKIDIKVNTTTFALSCSHGHPGRWTLFAAIWMEERTEPES